MKRYQRLTLYHSFIPRVKFTHMQISALASISFLPASLSLLLLCFNITNIFSRWCSSKSTKFQRLSYIAVNIIIKLYIFAQDLANLNGRENLYLKCFLDKNYVQRNTYFTLTIGPTSIFNNICFWSTIRSTITPISPLKKYSIFNLYHLTTVLGKIARTLSSRL